MVGQLRAIGKGLRQTRNFLFQIEQHARDRHNLILDDKGHEKIRAAIRREQ